MDIDKIRILKKDSFPGLFMVTLDRGGVAFIDINLICKFEAYADPPRVRYPDGMTPYISVVETKCKYMISIATYPETILNITEESMNDIISICHERGLINKPDDSKAD